CNGRFVAHPFRPQRLLRARPQGPADRTNHEKGEPWAEPNGSRDNAQGPGGQIFHCSCSAVAPAGRIAPETVNNPSTPAPRRRRSSRCTLKGDREQALANIAAVPRTAV